MLIACHRVDFSACSKRACISAYLALLFKETVVTELDHVGFLLSDSTRPRVITILEYPTTHVSAIVRNYHFLEVTIVNP